ncbi:MAG: molybdenum cofactor guanylyltransferase MobA [Venatoribacter sp.]
MNILPISIGILAGGRGSRMGDQDKGWVKWQGQALIEHMQQVVRPLTNDLIISCNRNVKRYAELADQVVTDPLHGFVGPLMGMIEVLKVAKHSHVLLLPCDAPLIDQALIQRLAKHRYPYPVALQQQGFLQPLFSLVPKSKLPEFERLWQQGTRSPSAVLKQLESLVLPCKDHDPRLANFNDPSFLTERVC